MEANYTNFSELPMQWEKPVLYTEEWMNTLGGEDVIGEGEDGVS